MSMLDSVFSLSVGLLIGTAYFTLVKDYYRRDYIASASDEKSFYEKLFADDFFKLD